MIFKLFVGEKISIAHHLQDVHASDKRSEKGMKFGAYLLRVTDFNEAVSCEQRMVV